MNYGNPGTCGQLVCVGHDDRRSDAPMFRTEMQRLSLAVLFVFATSQHCSAAPPYTIKQTPELCYVQKTTWFDSMLASRETLQDEEAAGRRPALTVSFHSEIVRGREPASPVAVTTSGVPEIYLYVTGAPDVEYGAADWIAPSAVDDNGNRKLLCSGKFIDLQQGFHTVDCSLRSRVDPPLRIVDKEYPHGINIQAPGKIRIKLPSGTVRFETEIGIDDWVNPTSYHLPQPFYYQPHHYSEAALRAPVKDAQTTGPTPNGAVRFHVTDAAGAARLDLWTRLAVDFSDQRSRQEMKWSRQDRLLEEDWAAGDWRGLARRFAAASFRVPGLRAEAMRLAAHVEDRSSFERVRAVYHRSREVDDAVARAKELNFDNVRDAVRDLIAEYGDRYPDGKRYLEQFDLLESNLASALYTYHSQQTEQPDPTTAAHELHQRILNLLKHHDGLRFAALTSNPLIDWDTLLLVRRTPHGDPRRAMGRGYGVSEYLGLPRQSSKCNPGIEQPLNWENDLCTLSPLQPDGTITTLYQPDDRQLLKDVDLDWSAERLLFSMPGSHDKWHVFQLNADGTDLQQLTPREHQDVHFYDPCYLPNGEIAMVSTAPLQGVPCNTGVIVGMMYKMDADGTNIRQIAFEQDHTYNPSVMPDGRILYLRWDYTDTPHIWNRVLFTMNPDGTGQSEFYGSNSYWPNSLFYSRAVPGHPTKFVGIVTGHHIGRAGELTLFDRSLGRHETDGVVQRISDRHGRVEPLIEDKLTQHSWPKFLNPYPLSDKHFLVSCKPTPDSLWGIYLVDVFDNLILLKEEEGRALLEPIPLRATPRPRVIPDRTVAGVEDGTVFLADIYAGPGLQGVPRGTVKSLRIFTYHFAFQKQAGIQHRVGADGPWEVKQVLGTVPVERDGSAYFRVPAKTPISLQPLDGEGKAIQLMRSWMTVMPGENRSCVGCHEDTTGAPTPQFRQSLAALKPPNNIEPWYGPARGFSFNREVQPVLDKYCVSCHDGSIEGSHKAEPDLRSTSNVVWAYKHGDPDLIRFEDSTVSELSGKYSGLFPNSYVQLRKQVRVGGLESDLHLLPPLEFHADTSRLVKLLESGHHGVKLSPEAWDRLIVWIDLNAPCHGTWSEFTSILGDQSKRRCELQTMYGGRSGDGERVVQGELPFGGDLSPVMPAQENAAQESRPHEGLSANRVGVSNGHQQYRHMELDLGSGVTMRLVRIPAGECASGISIDRPFWMGCCEVTNRQYAQLVPYHDSRFEHRGSWVFSEEYLGWPLNGPDQPVVRVSWEEASEFCQALSRQADRQVRLPSEDEWEYACRAGTSTPFWFGNGATDFALFANLADRSLRRLAYDSWGPKPPDLVARDDRFDDGQLVTAAVGSYAPNPFGLFDICGNVAEWTSGHYGAQGTRRAVRGGSWRDLPCDAYVSNRFGYYPFQKVFDVGFRVVVEDNKLGDVATQ